MKIVAICTGSTLYLAFEKETDYQSFKKEVVVGHVINFEVEWKDKIHPVESDMYIHIILEGKATDMYKGVVVCDENDKDFITIMITVVFTF